VTNLMKEERLRLILEAAHLNGKVTVAGLGQHLGVSEVTIRRDLRELDQRGLLHRTHGGALLNEPSTPEPPVISRMNQSGKYKKRIGEMAASLIHDGDSIFVGSGSTTAYMVRRLTERQNLTIVTNALNVAAEMAIAEEVTVVVLGGMLRSSELSLIGHITELALKEVRIDKVVLGIPAISLEAGLTNDYLPEVMTDRTIIEAAHELILVADHTKFGRVASAYLTPIERVTTLVTDSETPSAILNSIRELGVQVIVAE
jgi:DeoR/GlpR family transcriptional regulator of sugar metabolism